MKTVFVGPSLGSSISYWKDRYPDITFRGPAARGDILKAADDGAKTIALIDGYFGDSASVWHKEILYALSHGIVVGGGSSMGALRAAECQDFGMVGIGRIFAGYAAGDILDDEAVALIHGPEELGWMPLSVPRVDYEATIRKLTTMGLVSKAERERFLLTAQFMHYTERTYRTIVDQCEFGGAHRRTEILDHIKHHKVEQKREDAQAVLSWLDGVEKSDESRTWTFSTTTHWTRLREEISAEPGYIHDRII